MAASTIPEKSYLVSSVDSQWINAAYSEVQSQKAVTAYFPSISKS